jgi:hypothetical protein
MWLAWSQDFHGSNLKSSTRNRAWCRIADSLRSLRYYNNIARFMHCLWKQPFQSPDGHCCVHSEGRNCVSVCSNPSYGWVAQLPPYCVWSRQVRAVECSLLSVLMTGNWSNNECVTFMSSWTSIMDRWFKTGRLMKKENTQQGQVDDNNLQIWHALKANS